MRPLERIWHFFKEFNSTQFAAMTPEHEVANIGWYNRFGRHPYYGLTGLNSGVMLMNLTRMRTFDWTNKIIPLYREWKTKITWGDQDLINILFHFHPGELGFWVQLLKLRWLDLKKDCCVVSLIVLQLVRLEVGSDKNMHFTYWILYQNGQVNLILQRV